MYNSYNDDDEERNEELSPEQAKELVERFRIEYKRGQEVYYSEEEYEHLLWGLENERDFALGLAATQQAVGHHSYVALFKLREAHMLIHLDRFTEALEILEKIEPLFDFSEYQYPLTLAEALFRLGRGEEATKMLRERLEQATGDDRIPYFYAIAKVMTLDCNWDDAFENMEKVVRFDPQNPDMLQQLGWMLEQSELWEEKGLPIYTGLTELDPHSCLAWFGLGSAFIELERYEEAIDALDFALVIDEEHIPSLMDMGYALQMTDDFKGALARYNEVLALNEDTPELYTCIGQCYEDMEEDEEATRNFNIALEKNLGDVEAHCGLGNCLLREGKPKEALLHFLMAVELEPTGLEFYLGAGDAYSRLDLDQEAIEFYTKAIHIDTASVEAWSSLLEHLLDCDEYELAVQAADSMYEHTQSAEAMYFSGLAYLFMEQPKEAVAMLQLALNEDYDKHDILFEWIDNPGSLPWLGYLLEHYKP